MVVSECLALGGADIRAPVSGQHSPLWGQGVCWAVGEAEPDAPQALSTDSVERLPVYNKSAWRHYETIQEAGDWCVPSTEPKNTSTYRVT